MKSTPQERATEEQMRFLLTRAQPRPSVRNKVIGGYQINREALRRPGDAR